MNIVLLYHTAGLAKHANIVNYVCLGEPNTDTEEATISTPVQALLKLPPKP